MRRRWARGIGLVTVLIVAMFGLTACRPSPPLGVRKDGDKLTILIGYQCGGGPAGEVAWLRVTNIVKGNKLADSPLWEIKADKPRATPSVVLGVVPEGFHETVDNLGSQGPGDEFAVDVQSEHLYSRAFALKRMRDGQVLDSDKDVISEEEFNQKFACGK